MNKNLSIRLLERDVTESSLPSTESLMLQVSNLAFKFPALGIAQDLPALEPNELWGVLRYLKRYERRGAEYDKEEPL